MGDVKLNFQTKETRVQRAGPWLRLQGVKRQCCDLDGYSPSLVLRALESARREFRPYPRFTPAVWPRICYFNSDRQPQKRTKMVMVLKCDLCCVVNTRGLCPNNNILTSLVT